ncbi:MAG: MBL fold metallo-hydrolase [Firmicutes bacterium]|nr:MBL fold metallo-hydrolase [Bacillota bacterium]
MAASSNNKKPAAKSNSSGKALTAKQKQAITAKTTQATKAVSSVGGKNTAKVVETAARISAGGSKTARSKTIKPKKTKLRFVLFAVITIIMLATLPFGGIIEGFMRQTFADSDVIGAYNVVKNGNLAVHFVDVGQGDCIMVKLPDGKNMIIDGGSDTLSANSAKDRIENYANDVFFTGSNKKFDYMIATHSDADHINALDRVLEKFEVSTIYRPKSFFSIGTLSSNAARIAMQSDEAARIIELQTAVPSKLGASVTYHSTATYFNFLTAVYNKPGANVLYHEAGTVISGGGANPYKITFYSPNKTFYGTSDVNNLSAVVVIEYNGKSICLTGDAYVAAENEMIASTALPLPKVDALKLGHHGSSTSTSQGFLDALGPTYIFITVGEGNSYGHPTETILNRLDTFGILESNLFRADYHGNMVFAVSNNILGNNIAIAISQGEPFVVYINWWYIAGGIIVLAGVILFVPALVSKKK